MSSVSVLTYINIFLSLKVLFNGVTEKYWKNPGTGPGTGRYDADPGTGRVFIFIPVPAGTKLRYRSTTGRNRQFIYKIITCQNPINGIDLASTEQKA